MRTYYGYQVFTDRNVNTGQLDLRYVGITGNTSTPIFDNGINVSGSFISNATGVFLNSVIVSGDFILNGQKLIIPVVGESFDPSSIGEP